MEKELMRHFDWKMVIGLRYEWVNIPYKGRSKWNKRSSGCMMWHVYVRSRDAKRADRELRLWLHPSTPKKDFPWCAVTHYISDWKAAQNGTISVTGLVPFFTHHLGELTTTQANRVIAKWLSISLIHTTRRKELVWCLETLRARPSDQTLQGIDKAITFLV
ncbi:unnamed protein product [Cylindrotheca closterium]|uniref:Uncharacterized protein n=1 Tax=Cylindrotheca closterium TaxID=2856 RepID=A0AAD2G532_9STRA|nr:unnamed protein product [Cylindrotheca closterium]